MRQIIILMLSALLLISCGSSHENPNEGRMVKTMVIGEGSTGYARIYPGRVDAGQKVELSFQVAGTLKEFPVKEGMHVKEGDLLAALDDRDYKNRYEAAKAQLNTTELNYQRGETLVKSGTIAQATFDELRAKYETAKSNFNIHEKALRDTQLFAPFSGLVAKTFVDNYQEVQAKQKILSLQNVDEINILIDVPEKDIIRQGTVREGNVDTATLQDAYITFDALGDRQFKTHIKEYATEADPTTQTYRVKLSMKAPNDVTILPGMTANFVVKQQGQGNSESYYLPVNAVAVDAEGKFYVWILDAATMQVHKKVVEVGELKGDEIQVKSGVHAGERIVVAGVPYLEEGMKVRLYSNKY